MKWNRLKSNGNRKFIQQNSIEQKRVDQNKSEQILEIEEILKAEKVEAIEEIEEVEEMQFDIDQIQIDQMQIGYRLDINKKQI